MHSPTTSDYLNAYYYIRWKYATVLATTDGTFTNVMISEDSMVECDGVDAVACTTGTNVVFGTNVFSRSENRAASIIGHELVHAALGWLAGECPAYQWQKDHDAGTGVFPCDSQYLNEVRQELFDRQ